MTNIWVIILVVVAVVLLLLLAIGVIHTGVITSLGAASWS